MAVFEVSGADDPRISEYRNVPDPELLQQRGVFIAEGRHVVRRLLTASRYGARSLLLTPAAHAGLADVLRERPDLPVFVVSQDIMNAITGFNIHRGCLGVGERTPMPPWQEVVSAASRVVVLEHVSNADNVGGIFRSAAAFGADAVLLGPSCTDPLYRKAIRTSMGAALRVPFAAIGEWPRDLARLREAGCTLIALTPAADAVPLRVAVAPGFLTAHGFSPAKVALLVGHEGEGLSREALHAADVRARIPMQGGVDSLNVATAAAIALYELSQR